MIDCIQLDVISFLSLTLLCLKYTLLMIMINRGDRVKRERDDCIYANFEFPLFLSFEMDTFVHGLGRMLVCALFSLMFMMAFFLLIYICIYKTSVCERKTHYSCDGLH